MATHIAKSPNLIQTLFLGWWVSNRADVERVRNEHRKIRKKLCNYHDDLTDCSYHIDIHLGVLDLNELTKTDVFDLVGVTEEEFNEHYNQLVESKEWMKQFKDKFLKAVLEGGMMPGDYPVTLKTKYIDFQVIYPKQEPTFILDNEIMKATDIDVDIIDPITGEVSTRRVNAYEWFKKKQKKPSAPYVKENPKK